MLKNKEAKELYESFSKEEKQRLEKYNHEELYYKKCEKTNLKAIAAIHTSKLGPLVSSEGDKIWATGGTRFYNYKNEFEALIDALRLSEGMSRKNAVAGVKMGGSKCVIIGDPKTLKTPELLRSYGEFIEELGGKLNTGEDMNINQEDVKIMAQTTKFTRLMTGGKKNVGTITTVPTARGVFRGIQAGAFEVWGNKSLKGKTVAVQGIGGVGYLLCKWLYEDGANIIVSDINEEATRRAENEFGAKSVHVNEILNIECDVFSPCAGGGIVDSETAKSIKVKLIAGAANNVLKEIKDGDILHERGILYIPDYVINAGGVISVEHQVSGEYDIEKINERLDNIYTAVSNIIKLAKEKNIPTSKAADEYADEIINR